jgi:asparagine synthase (glutamine-hydrolysing)
MCGIAGIVYADSTHEVNRAAFDVMIESLLHRGPDDGGQFVAPGVALGSRRLAILDLSQQGHMPMRTEDGRYHLVYNGEVYNFKELRDNLRRKGVGFRSNTDTEVVLQMYAAYGTAMLPMLNGMFAFAIWDCIERKLVLGRDRLGIKPLFYADLQSALIFASEEKALFMAGLRAEPDPETIDELLCYKFVSGERTPFVGVKRLLPGHTLTWQNGQYTSHRWWSLAERTREIQDRSPDDLTKWFRETFDDAVGLRKISDVPIGVMLSGGLDSGSVVASLAEMDGQAETTGFTVRFKDQFYDEGLLAQEVARRFNVRLHELYVDPENILHDLQEATWFNDEPLMHASSLHILALSQFAKSRVTVLLSGEGSDELLGGYVRYRALHYARLLWSAGRIPVPLGTLPGIPARIDKFQRYASLCNDVLWITCNACDVFPDDWRRYGRQTNAAVSFREKVYRESASVYPNDRFRQAMYVDQHTFLCSLLDRNDRMTMGASIECRVPFLDYRLVEGAAALPSNRLLPRSRRNKWLLRQSIGNRLPRAILEGRKWGFGVPWADHFIKVKELHDLVQDLPNHSFMEFCGFKPDNLRRLVKDFMHREPRASALIYQLLMLVIWKDSYHGRLSGQRRKTDAMV